MKTTKVAVKITTPAGVVREGERTVCLRYSEALATMYFAFECGPESAPLEALRIRFGEDNAWAANWGSDVYDRVEVHLSEIERAVRELEA